MHPFKANLLILGMALAVVALLCTTGCTDNFTGADDPALIDEAPPARTYAGPKFRHAHLLDRAINRDELGLIIAIQPGVDKQGLHERYAVHERY